jgi:1-acyl-sn-glycerol-3-phosphate acyltransferase
MLGRCRYFVKKEIVKLPFFGWAFWVGVLTEFE